MNYIILNFAYGYGPFLRATELASAVNDVLEVKTGNRFGIIIPWIYGDAQKKIMKQAYRTHLESHPDELLLDETLGKYLNSIFYGASTYEESLKHFLNNGTAVQNEIHKYISDGLHAVTFNGKKINIRKKDIAFEINRNPRITIPIEKSYYTNFAYASEILERAIDEPDIAVDKKMIEQAIPKFKEIENNNSLYFIFEPSTFTHNDYADMVGYKIENTLPPLERGIAEDIDLEITERGIYVTVSGISQVADHYQILHELDLPIYTNVPHLIPGSIEAPPSIISHKNIVLHISRSGWGSIWLSWRTQTPFIALPYDSNDDPEIFFNNRSIQKYGLGEILQRNTLPDIGAFTKRYRKNIEVINKNLMEKHNTLDGTDIISQDIVHHYLRN